MSRTAAAVLVKDVEQRMRQACCAHIRQREGLLLLCSFAHCLLFKNRHETLAGLFVCLTNQLK